MNKPSFVGNFSTREELAFIKKKESIIRLSDFKVTVKDPIGDIVDNWDFPFKQWNMTKYVFQTIDLEPLEEIDIISWQASTFFIFNVSSEIETINSIISFNNDKTLDLNFCDVFCWRGIDQVTGLKLKNSSVTLTQTLKILIFK